MFLLVPGIEGQILGRAASSWVSTPRERVSGLSATRSYEKRTQKAILFRPFSVCYSGCCRFGCGLSNLLSLNCRFSSVHKFMQKENNTVNQGWTNPCQRVAEPLNLMKCRLIFVGHQYGTCFMSPSWLALNFVEASRFKKMKIKFRAPHPSAASRKTSFLIMLSFTVQIN